MVGALGDVGESGAANARGGRTEVGGPTLPAHVVALAGSTGVEVGGAATIGRPGESVMPTCKPLGNCRAKLGLMTPALQFAARAAKKASMVAGSAH